MNMHGNTDILAKALDASWLRTEMYSSNISNVDTPGYKRKDIAFEAYLEQAIGSGRKLDEKQLNRIEPMLFEDKTNLSYKLDGNNVDMDTEMSYLIQNQIKYNTLTSQINYNFKLLKMVLER